MPIVIGPCPFRGTHDCLARLLPALWEYPPSSGPEVLFQPRLLRGPGACFRRGARPVEGNRRAWGGPGTLGAPGEQRGPRNILQAVHAVAGGRVRQDARIALGGPE